MSRDSSPDPSELNLRDVSACAAIDFQQERVLLVSRRKNPDLWTFPKGGKKKKESSEQAAIRETFEEAGVRGEITQQLGTWVVARKSGRNLMKVFEMSVTSVAQDWPEKGERERKWMTFDDAMNALSLEMKEALLRSSLRAELRQQQSQKKEEL